MVGQDKGNKDGLLHGLICWALGLPGGFSGWWGHRRWVTMWVKLMNRSSCRCRVWTLFGPRNRVSSGDPAYGHFGHRTFRTPDTSASVPKCPRILKVSGHFGTKAFWSPMLRRVRSLCPDILALVLKCPAMQLTVEHCWDILVTSWLLKHCRPTKWMHTLESYLVLHLVIYR